MADRSENGIDSLLNLAVLAPSGDNTQPWKFVVDSRNARVGLQVDETRDPSPMNSGQRMARVSLGAVLENLIRAANSQGWQADLEPATPPNLAVVRLSRSDSSGEPDSTLTTRTTNRRLYDRRSIPEDALTALKDEVPEFENVKTYWIASHHRLTALADVLGPADALMFSKPSMRHAFLSKVRFDCPPDEVVSHGLSFGSLEVSATDRLALRIMTKAPNWLLQVGGAGRVFAAKARQLIESASGVCLVVAPDTREATDLNVGRVMQRAWLALARRGIAAQPMMSLMVLENAVEYHDPALASSADRDRVADFSRRFRELIPEIGAGRPAFLLRFGYAPEPSGRTGRLDPTVIDESGK